MKSLRVLWIVALIAVFVLMALKYIPFLPLDKDLLDLLSAIGETLFIPVFLLFLLSTRHLPSPSSPTSTEPTLYGGLWFRFAAGILDLGMFSMVASGIGRAFSDLVKLHGARVSAFKSVEGLGRGSQGIAMILFGLGIYYVLMESSPLEASFGKILLRLRVTDLAGRRISLARATIRYLGKLFSLGTFLLGLLVAIFTKRKQALHDLLAKTVVVDA